jgi:hypothetical protein
MPIASIAPIVASTVIRMGWVTAAAMPIWLSAAIANSAMIAIEARLARNRP